VTLATLMQTMMFFLDKMHVRRNFIRRHARFLSHLYYVIILGRILTFGKNRPLKNIN